MISSFIKNFQNEGTIETFTQGCCYWFAEILNERFPGGRIMYHPIDNHFAYRYQGKLYDVTGEICDEGFTSWYEYQLFEPLESQRIIRNCILKLD